MFKSVELLNRIRGQLKITDSQVQEITYDPMPDQVFSTMIVAIAALVDRVEGLGRIWRHGFETTITHRPLCLIPMATRRTKHVLIV